MYNMKTKKEWQGSLEDYLQVGDKVDTELYEHFINVLPPRTFRNDLVQIGEPYSTSNEGKTTYLTIANENGSWVYKGTCHAGETNHQESKY